MTLLTRHIEAGWHEVELAGRKAAEKFHSLPGATSSIIRVEADTQDALHREIDLRELRLTGTDEPIRDTITNDGTLVTGGQHEALRTEGLEVSGESIVVHEPVPNEDEAKQAADFDATAGSVNAPQVPSDAADQGMSPEAVSASETASGSADTSTDPSQNAEPATTPPPEGEAAQSLPESDHAAALADAPSDAAESQSTQSDDEVDATPAAEALAEEKGVDLTQVEGSGQDGRVLKSDVADAAKTEE